MPAFMLMAAGLFITGGIYMTTRFYRFGFIRRVRNRSKLLAWLVSALPVIVFIILTLTGILEAVVVAIHLAAAFLICDLIGLILKKLFGKTFTCYLAGILAIALTGVYMGYAWINAHTVVRTDYTIAAPKALGDVGNLRIAQITDAHIGTTFSGEKLADYITEIMACQPDLLVITGDFTDEDTSYTDMVQACSALGKFDIGYGVYMVFGNHDLNTYSANPAYTPEQLITELQKNNVHILQDETVLVDDRFYICGRQDRTVRSRKPVSELLSGIDSSKFVLLLDHQPVEYQAAAEAGVSLMLSGHTHGGQLFPLQFTDTLTSSNEMVYGIRNAGQTAYIVSSGISEWGIALRTGVATEYVIIDVQ